MCVERSVAKTAAASVAATTAPRRTDSSQERSKSDVRGDAREEGADDDADRAQERRRHRDLAQAAPRGLEPALVEDQRKADHSDPAGELRVVELDPARAVRAEQHPEREEGDEDRQPGAGGTQSDDEAAQPGRAPTRRRTRPSSTLTSCRVGVAAVAWNTSAMATRPRTRKIGRLSEIAQVAVRHGFGYFFERHKLTDILPWTARVEPSPDAAIGSERGRHLREMLDELGPTFVKFGQLLSTRPDVVPPDIVAELRGLQDDVRPFPFAQVRVVVEEELGLTLEQAFVDFDEKPIAAASIGQVHRATLPNGDEVVVKVQRPNAPRQIESDLALLYQAARMIKERVRALDFIDAHELVDEFARFIRQELDYKLEARHADTFRRNFADSESSSCRRSTGTTRASRMLTLEFLDGVQLADLDRRDDLAGGAARACLPGVADLDGDDLPARLLPRRSASRERARAGRGAGSASSTSGSSES